MSARRRRSSMDAPFPNSASPTGFKQAAASSSRSSACNHNPYSFRPCSASSDELPHIVSLK
eukprot:CAMPEP_0119128822 /NCGR_PEP_ID=MMETSP1310-20130426/6821_1 /TAXON_ID=464262 /ORGANISM="Genus nov. species nov., Strain RCC2339" /LENGTH=60 /DNA_ID=CAMNT_0007119195 /DNA_START=21 /DNA_END=203 /DNA_ORIENTATION=+